MVAMKRKAVTKYSQKTAAIASKEDVEESVDESEEEEHEEEEHAEEEDVVDNTADRRKELKTMPVDDLKELVEGFGLDKGKKVDMVEAVLKHEERTRQMEQEKAENMRKVMVDKTQELATMAAPTIKEQCIAAGILGNLSKQERVERLLKHWQEHDGVNKALAQINCDKREAELNDMDCDDILELCDEAEIDTLVKEIMVDRIIRKEATAGKFDPPVKAKLEEKKPIERESAKTDLVATLLANEAERAKRKAEEEKQKEREALMAKKKDVLKALTVSELKQRLSKAGLPSAGHQTKDELVEALYSKEIEDEALNARKAELKALGKDGLKELLASKGLEGGGVNDMIETLFKHEAQCEQNIKEYEKKVMEQLKIKKGELDKLAGNALKEMCSVRGLAVGVAADDRVQRLLRHAKENGDIDKAISMAAQKSRREVLEGMDKPALQALCDKIGVDMYVKAILIERLLHFESEAGRFAHDAVQSSEPPAKKQRSKK